ncbi:M61 family metallopeptidase [Mucilaginibacter calamicampi]|uniref:M61 family metallopeptidase n=1 Tax=Mucilaginibacter calamicampi TaxID=1302352 RepID=A0ABW2YWY0_9SPHI
MNTTTGYAANNEQIKYTLTFPEAQAHYVDVEMTISGLAQKTLDLKMPVWAPGSYLVREFTRNIESLSVSAAGKALPAVKTRKNIWHIDVAGKSTVTVKYRVYAFEVSVRTSFIDAEHAFLSSPDIFIYPDGMLKTPSTVHIVPYKGWTTVSTSLEKVNGDSFTRTAPNYDILFDSPLEVGTQDVFGFKVGDTDYEVAMSGGGNYNKERVKKDFTRIVEQEVAVFGENPNRHYTFIIHNYLKGGGGLEHLSSTTLGATRDGYTHEGTYQSFLSLAAHEHFHLWNVKRLRPIALGPFDYDNENYTTNLWIAEGFTAYYQDVIVRRTQLYAPQNYLDLMARQITLLDNQPGAKVQSAAMASYDAWIKSYRPNENSANTTISYYTKGAVIAMMLDLEIINNTKGKNSLDDVMRYMYNEYYKVKKRGYTDAEFKLALEKFAGKNLDEFYAKYINDVTDIDYNSYLAYAGCKLTDDLAGSNTAALGITMIPNTRRVIVATVLRGTAAWDDGINVNDEIIAIDGKPADSKEPIGGDKKPGDKILVKLIRDGLEKEIPVTLKRSTTVKYKIEQLANATPQQLVVRKKWMTLQ